MPRPIKRKDDNRLSKDTRQAVAVWIEENPGVLTKIAHSYQKSRPFVSLILRGRRSSKDGMIERALRKAGAPVTFAATLLLLLALLTLVPSPGQAQSPRLTVTPASVTATAGKTAVLGVNYTGTNSGVQWTLPIPPNYSIQFIPGSGLGTSKKLYQYQTLGSAGQPQINVVVYGDNQVPLPNAELAKIQIQVPATAQAGPLNLFLASVRAVNPNGSTDSTINDMAPFALTISLPKVDLNNDGKVDNADLKLAAGQLMDVLAALGLL